MLTDKQWVYIYVGRDGHLITGTSPTATHMASFLRRTERKVIYLRPFSVPFEALAHKCLLERLSFSSLRATVIRSRDETKMWIGKIGDLLNTTDSDK